jgi:hypothetical protein
VPYRLAQRDFLLVLLSALHVSDATYLRCDLLAV